MNWRARAAIMNGKRVESRLRAAHVRGHVPMKKPNLGILIKPASYDCNMACSYCYYRPVHKIYRDEGRPRMSPQTFEAV